MNKIRLTVLTVAIAVTSFAQKNNIVNTWNYLNSKELDKAKDAIDKAAVHDDTKSSPKMYLYRAKTYLAILETRDDKFRNLDPDAAEKAFSACVNCYKTDKDKMFTDENKILLGPTASRLYNKMIEAQINKQYETAIRYCQLLYEGLPFDKEDAMKHANITSETLDHDMYILTFVSGNTKEAKVYIQKMIDAKKYKDPNLYRHMADIYLQEKDTAKALSYIEQGKLMFDDNADLIRDEINIYLAEKKPDVLLDKINKAIEVTPDNEILYFTKGTIYQGKNELDKAEAAYKKALELKPDYADANYNMGGMLVNNAVALNAEAEKLPPKETKKYAELNDKANDLLKKALPFLEKAYAINSTDMDIAKNLKALYQRMGDNEKYMKMKDDIEKMKKQQKQM